MTRIEALMIEIKALKQERDLWKKRFEEIVKYAAGEDCPGECPANTHKECSEIECCRYLTDWVMEQIK
jgi:hypothetical protein